MSTSKTALLAVILGLFLLPTVAGAVPLQLAHQGELANADGPVTDTVEMTFRLWENETVGYEVWSETRFIDVVGGHYSVLLGGTGQSTPIQDVLLQEPELWLEITIGSEAPLLPRLPVASTPYAIAAHTVENLSGGTVDASSVSINGAEVIDGTGTWTGGAGSVDWTALANVPTDADTIAGLSCANGARPVWDGALWICTQVDWSELQGTPAGFVDGIDDDTDTVLTQPEVLSHVGGQVIDFGAGSSVAGVDIATTSDLTWTSLSGVPAGFSDDVDDDVLGDLGVARGATGWTGGHERLDQTLAERWVVLDVQIAAYRREAGKPVEVRQNLVVADAEIHPYGCEVRQTVEVREGVVVVDVETSPHGSDPGQTVKGLDAVVFRDVQVRAHERDAVQTVKACQSRVVPDAQAPNRGEVREAIEAA